MAAFRQQFFLVPHDWVEILHNALLFFLYLQKNHCAFYFITKAIKFTLSLVINQQQNNISKMKMKKAAILSKSL